MSRAVVHSRVSSDQQDTQHQSLALTEWDKRRGYEVVGAYEETESTWRARRQGSWQH